MLRIVQVGNTLPFSFPVDPNAEFQPGQIAQLSVMGNQVVCGVSDGRVPIGIIDDIKTKSFTAAAIDEVIIAPAVGVPGPNNTIVTPVDIKIELANPNVLPSSFVSDPVDVELIPRNGVIIFLAGTPLNFSMTDSGVPDAIRTRVSYTYQIPNIPGDDSTAGSGRVTVWFSRIIAQTDQYDTAVRYPVNATLFVNEKGQLTTRRISDEFPGVAIVTGPPTTIHSALEFLWL
ncbi:MAG TPA: hypothetical protein VM577_14155 [Anaerovoracaceae bacterium]|nr:hypothetical protein [Anaerovoracaceae bacterium]